mgnify:CR=1 FL=1
MKLFKFVKGIFGRSATAPVAVESVVEETAVSYAEPELSPVGSALPSEGIPTGVPVAAEPEVVGEVDVNNSEVVLPLASILPAFPQELQQRVIKARAEDATIALPMANLLSQLA